MSNTSGSERDHELVEPQMVCDACARVVMAGTEWHSMTDAQPSRQPCGAGDGAGYWVCSDCHDIIHDWMDRNPEAEQPAKEGFHRIFKGLAQILEDGPRKYRRSPLAGEQPPPGESP